MINSQLKIANNDWSWLTQRVPSHFIKLSNQLFQSCWCDNNQILTCCPRLNWQHSHVYKKIWDFKFRVAENGLVQKICHPQTKHHVVFAVDFLGFYRSQNTTTSKLVPSHRDIPNCPLSTGVLHHGNRPQMQTERLTTWWWPTNTWFQSWHQSQVLQHTLLGGWRYDCLGVAVVINLKDGNVVFSYVEFL